MEIVQKSIEIHNNYKAFHETCTWNENLIALLLSVNHKVGTVTQVKISLNQNWPRMLLIEFNSNSLNFQ